MINITIYKSKNHVCGIECSGHSGYAPYGSDIVCSSVSSLVCACHLGFAQVAKNVKFLHKQDDENGYFKLMLLQPNHDAEVILQTVVGSIREIAEGYKKYIAIKYKESKNEIY